MRPRRGVRLAVVVALAVLVAAGCHREPPPPAPVASIDDPRLPDWTGSLDGVAVSLDVDGSAAQQQRWRDDAGSLDFNGVARLAPDIVVVQVQQHVYGAPDAPSRFGQAFYAVDCKAKLARLLSTELDGIEVEGLGDGTRPWPEAGPPAEMFATTCDNRFRCEMRKDDSVCRYETGIDIEQHDRRSALRDAAS